MTAEGHDVGSHLWSHGRGARPGATLVRELLRTSTAIRRVTGTSPRWFRPPYGRSTPAVGWIARAAGMRTVTWDVDSRDWEAAGPADVVERVLRSARPGSIVLLHEGSNGLAVEALPSIVDNLRVQGLRAVTLSDLLRRG
jgi:peptidoglycan/xylan/chitin deacetylase (PgdA/CDA1 family)